MLTTDGITLGYGERTLFKNVSLKFMDGNCYGLIGANGAGKSTFLKILAGDIESDQGTVSVPSGQRIAVLRQNQFEFDELEVLKTVLMGNSELYSIMQEKEILYAKADFTDEDGIRSSELEVKFADLGGWDAESQAAEMLESLGVPVSMHTKLMKELEPGLKVRVLLAQALSGNPDVLLLDEPTNNLDLPTIAWLEEFLCDSKNTVIVVSHDRHFLDKVCTHIADIDFGEISLYTGNYSFWYQSSQLVLKQRSDRNKKSEEKAKELKAFIERFSANAAKSKQATSRKKMLTKLSLEEIKPSNRKYPHIVFGQEREAGRDMLKVVGLEGVLDGEKVIRNLDLEISKGEKVAFIGKDPKIPSYLLELLSGVAEPTAGEIRWGVTTSPGYFPKNFSNYFEEKKNLVEWLRNFATTKEQREEEYLRGFLGKMLFSGEEVKKMCNVLSGGEKVRCMLSKLMMGMHNVLILDEPTNHLDLESITSLNNGLIDYKGTLLFISQDRETVETIADRIIEVGPKGIIDKQMKFDEYLESPQVAAERELIY